MKFFFRAFFQTFFAALPQSPSPSSPPAFPAGAANEQAPPVLFVAEKDQGRAREAARELRGREQGRGDLFAGLQGAAPGDGGDLQQGEFVSPLLGRAERAI